MPFRPLAVVAVSAVLIGGLIHAAPASAAACAPTTTSAGEDIVVTFSAIGACDWTVPSWVTSVRVLVVGAGGGGGVNGRGGGGGGGVQEEPAWAVTPGLPVTVTVGAGGTGAYYGPAYISWANSQLANTVPGTNGGNSSFGALTSLGGGSGSGSYGGGAINAGDGGSGGGCTGCASAGQGTAGQGYAGSTDGGGGGAGGAGAGWNGGPGFLSDITGSSVAYGGGGGRGVCCGSPGGSASAGGGAGGTNIAFPGAGTSGLGGGGGGGGLFPDNARLSDFSNDMSIGGAGGSGVVIVRFAPQPPPPPPPEPARPPREVVSVAGDRSVTVTWKAPEHSGSFPITHYQVTLGPGGRTCIVAAPATTCRISGLTNGTAYTATVKALTGAGWGMASEPSTPVTPAPPPPPSLSAVVDRSERAEGVVRVQRSSTMLPAGTRIWVYVHERDPWGYLTRAPGASNPVIAADGSFTWQRMINPTNTFELIWCTQPQKKGVCSPWTLL